MDRTKGSADVPRVERGVRMRDQNHPRSPRLRVWPRMLQWGEFRQPGETIAQTSPPQLRHMAVEGSAVPEGENPLLHHRLT
jgi:hypothetical protein